MSESDQQSPPGAIFKCPHCGFQHVVHIQASEVVAVYKCPKCGELVAPARKES